MERHDWQGPDPRRGTPETWTGWMYLHLSSACHGVRPRLHHLWNEWPELCRRWTFWNSCGRHHGLWWRSLWHWKEPQGATQWEGHTSRTISTTRPSGSTGLAFFPNSAPHGCIGLIEPICDCIHQHRWHAGGEQTPAEKLQTPTWSSAHMDYYKISDLACTVMPVGRPVPMDLPKVTVASLFPLTVIDWASKRLTRVCRSSLSAEADTGNGHWLSGVAQVSLCPDDVAKPTPWQRGDHAMAWQVPSHHRCSSAIWRFSRLAWNWLRRAPLSRSR